MTLRPDWSALRDNVRIGARWLTTSEQVADAVGDHLGYGVHVGGGLTVSFAGSGYVGAKGRHPGVVVVSLDLSSEQAEAGMPAPDPFTDAEIAAIRALLIEAGLNVVHEWNGAGLRTGSFGVDGVSPTVARSVDNYLRSCPRHHTVFCGGWQARHTAGGRTGDDLDDYLHCDWHSGGAARMVLPEFVAVPYQVPADGGTPPDSDRNLRVVQEALERIRPLLADMDVHAATVTAGARGHIDGDDRLEFVRDDGYGVNLPAEVALHLVALAAAALEAGVVERVSEPS